MNLVVHVLGLDNLSGRWYGFWSGIGGDVALFAWIPLSWHLIRRHNCHQRRCWKVGRYPFSDDNNTQWHFCRTHHPAEQPGNITEER